MSELEKKENSGRDDVKGVNNKEKKWDQTQPGDNRIETNKDLVSNVPGLQHFLTDINSFL